MVCMKYCTILAQFSHKTNAMSSSAQSFYMIYLNVILSVQHFTIIVKNTHPNKNVLYFSF